MEKAQSGFPFRQKLVLILFGLILFLVLLEIGLRFSGFIISSLQEQRNKISLKHANSLRIMCLGESTTAQGGADSYPIQLEKILNERSIGVKFSVINKGVRATNTSIILSELEGNIKKYKPNIVLAMIGINDSGKHMPYEPPVNSNIILFIRSLKVYKLSRYLWLHIVTRLREFHSDMHEKEQEPIGQVPKTEAAYIELGNYYRDDKHRNTEAEAVYKKGLELFPQSAQLHLELARFYRDQSLYDLAVQYYKKTLAIDSLNNRTYVELGRYYRDNLKYPESETLLQQAIKIDPENDGAYRELAWFYSERGEFSRAEALYRKAIELNPKDTYNYIQFGRFFYDAYRKYYAQAEECFKKAIAIDPAEDRAGALQELGRLSREIKKYEQAEACFKQAIALNPNDRQAYAGLALTYEEEGKKDLSQRCYKKAESLNIHYFDNPHIGKNYLEIKKILDKHRILLVCVQYPMCNIRPLQGIFRNENGIIFVNNEKLFKENVAKTGYDDYFVDMFAGEFGHCNRKGNRLLAEHIADVILNELPKRIRR